MLKPIHARSAQTITAPITAAVMIADLPLPCRRLLLFPMADILPQHEQHVTIPRTIYTTYFGVPSGKSNHLARGVAPLSELLRKLRKLLDCARYEPQSADQCQHGNAVPNGEGSDC